MPTRCDADAVIALARAGTPACGSVLLLQGWPMSPLQAAAIERGRAGASATSRQTVRAAVTGEPFTPFMGDDQ